MLNVRVCILPSFLTTINLFIFVQNSMGEALSCVPGKAGQLPLALRHACINSVYQKYIFVPLCSFGHI